jgi:uncharacterized membrane protein
MFPYQNPYAPLLSTIRATYRTHLFRLNMVTRIMLGAMSSVPSLYRSFHVINIIWCEKHAICLPDTNDTNIDIELCSWILLALDWVKYCDLHVQTIH